MKRQHFISPPASLSPHPFCGIRAFAVLFCRVLLSDKSRKRADALKKKKPTPLPLERRHLEWLGGRVDLIPKKNIKRRGSREDFQGYSATMNCALKPLCFFLCCANLLLCGKKSLLPLSLPRSRLLLRLPWENDSRAAEGERWRGICCCGSERSCKDSLKQITRIGRGRTHWLETFFAQGC